MMSDVAKPASSGFTALQWWTHLHQPRLHPGHPLCLPCHLPSLYLVVIVFAALILIFLVLVPFVGLVSDSYT
jgi:hypothetical protein